MPDNVIKKIDSWGHCDHGTGSLRFANGNNEQYEWDVYANSPLVKDNSPDPLRLPLAPYPDIPAKMPGVPLVQNNPVETIVKSSITQEQCVTNAVYIANFCG